MRVSSHAEFLSPKGFGDGFELKTRTRRLLAAEFLGLEFLGAEAGILAARKRQAFRYKDFVSDCDKAKGIRDLPKMTTEGFSPASDE